MLDVSPIILVNWFSTKFCGRTLAECEKVKHTSYWLRVQIHELRVQIYELRVQLHKLED